MVFEPKGIIPAMVTPFKRNYELDEEGVGRIVEWLLKGGVQGIFVSGSQGEFWALTEEEKKKLFEKTVDLVNGRAAVYAGTGAESTLEVIKLTEIARDVGVDAASIITPYYIKPNNEEMLEHYETIAEKVDIPIILYDNPGRTGNYISIDVVTKLVDECSNIVGIKDSSGDFTRVMEILEKCGDKMSVLMGRDTLIYTNFIHGGKGAISACANVSPRLVENIYQFYLKGELKRALEAQWQLAPLRHAFSLGSFPVVIKETLNIMGIQVGPCRPPILPMTTKNREKLIGILSNLNLIEK